MARTTSELKAIVARYVRHLQAHQIQVQKVILFGSYARGTAKDDSDIDMAFVSEDFDRFSLFERQRILAECRDDLTPTDVLGFSPSMLERKREHSAIVHQILREGIAIYPP